MEAPLDISKELAALRHEKKNQHMKSLPPSLTVQRRPLHHAPIASPYAGAHVEKVVYVSCRTPIMSAVKRVRKLLSHVEKRALQGTDTKGHDIDQVSAQVAAITDRLSKNSEEILVKASGRAMSQALKIGEWFRCKEKEMLCNVKIRTGNVQAIDDIVSIEDQHEETNDMCEIEEDKTALEGGETTMELLGDMSKSEIFDSKKSKTSDEAKKSSEDKTIQENSRRKRKRSRRKRAQYDKDDVPEARLRWIKTVEIAISLRP